jgi:hypothetical protein
MLDSGQSSRAHKAGYKNVITDAFNVQAQLDRLHRPILSNDPIAWFHLIGGGKTQILRIASPS